MMPTLNVVIQEDDFCSSQLQQSLLMGEAAEGAIVAFTGYVRVSNGNQAKQHVEQMLLEHYPGMTERSIAAIMEQAAQRWDVMAAAVVHRVGTLNAGDQIVWVGVSSAHRESAFAACDFIMDYLKTQAPFWKKEMGPEGGQWVDARCSDEDRLKRWQDT